MWVLFLRLVTITLFVVQSAISSQPVDYILWRNLERRKFRRAMCRPFAGAAEIPHQTQLLRLRKPEM